MRSSYGILNVPQFCEVQRHVQGRVVYDLGCGNLCLSQILVTMGASMVEAVDDDHHEIGWRSPHPQIRLHETRFNSEELAEERMETAFLSWPTGYANGLARLLLPVSKVIYLGSNCDSILCGPRDMWEQFAYRPLLAHIPARANTLLVYGPAELELPRFPPQGEERARLEDPNRIYSYEDLYPQVHFGEAEAVVYP